MQNYEFEVNLKTLDVEHEVSAFEAVFAKELTEDLARTYVASLVEKLGGIDRILICLWKKEKHCIIR